MRILMIHNDYALAGGETRSVATEVESLRQAGLEIKLFSVTNHGLPAAKVAINTVLPDKSVREDLRSVIRSYRPDLIHAQNIFPLLGAPAIEVMCQEKVPWVRTLRNYRLQCLSANHFRNQHDCFSCSSAAGAWPGVQHACYRDSYFMSAGALAYAKRETRAADIHPPKAYIAISRSMKNDLSNVLNGKTVHVCPNAVLKCTAPRGTTSSTGDRTPTFVFAGRTAPGKGVEDFIEIARSRPEYNFRIVGDGPLRAVAKGAHSLLANLTFVGHKPWQDLMTELSEARAVIVPSTWREPFGRIAAEAISVGTPAIVSDRGGLPEIVLDIDPALVVRGGNLGNWVSAVDAIALLPRQQYHNLRYKAERKWEREYSRTAIASRLTTIYNQSIGNTAGFDSSGER